MSIGYCLLEYANIYDEEFIQITDAGIPIKVYSDKEKAEKDCYDANVKAFRGIDVMRYGYIEDISDYDEEELRQMLPFNFNPSAYENIIPTDLSDEEMNRIIQAF